MKIKAIENPSNKVMSDRASIRKYDPSVKFSRDILENILQDAMTAPSSLNLQPWRFVIVESKEGKELIKPFMMFNEQQCEISSAIIAVFGDLECASSAEKIYSSAYENKLITEEVKNRMIEMISQYTSSYTPERLSNSIMLDCGFVGMQLMLSAKNYGYDTNPIGGYMRDELTEALGMDRNRYLPIVLLSIGKSKEDQKHDSIRFSVSDVTQWR